MTDSGSIATFADDTGPFGDIGYQVVSWADAGSAHDVRAALQLRADTRAVTRNLHLRDRHVQAAVTAPDLVGAVAGVLGPVVAVENTFLVMKPPRSDFTVPAHQDGINDRLVLDPARSVAAWLAITTATVVNGCLQVVPGSHRAGYLPYGRSTAPGEPLAALDPPEQVFTAVELAPGQACLMDVRLLHRSDANHTGAARVGLNVRYVAPGAIHHRCGPAPDLFALTGTWPVTLDRTGGSTP